MILEQNSKEELVRANQRQLFGVLRAVIQCFLEYLFGCSKILLKQLRYMNCIGYEKSI